MSNLVDADFLIEIALSGGDPLTLIDSSATGLFFSPEEYVPGLSSLFDEIEEEDDVSGAVDAQGDAAAIGRVIPKLILALKTTKHEAEKRCVQTFLEAAIKAHTSLSAASTDLSGSTSNLLMCRAREDLSNFKGLVAAARELESSISPMEVSK